MLLKATEMNIELMEVLQKSPKRSTLCHLGEGVDILGEALAAIAVLAIGAGDVGVGVVDIAGQEHTCVDLAPVAAHLLAVLATGIEIGDLIGAEDVVHILRELGLQGCHDSELLADEDLGEQVVGSRKDHGLPLEVLDVGALGEELGHIAYLVACLLGETLTGAREDGGADEDGDIGELADELLHKGEVLGAVILGGDMDLQEGNVYIAQVIVVALGRVADEEFAFGVVVF